MCSMYYVCINMHKYSADELKQSAVCLRPGTDLIYPASCAREAWPDIKQMGHYLEEISQLVAVNTHNNGMYI